MTALTAVTRVLDLALAVLIGLLLIPYAIAHRKETS